MLGGEIMGNSTLSCVDLLLHNTKSISVTALTSKLAYSLTFIFPGLQLVVCVLMLATECARLLITLGVHRASHT